MISTTSQSGLAEKCAAQQPSPPCSSPCPRQHSRRTAATPAPASMPGSSGSRARPRPRAFRRAPSRRRLSGVSYDPTVVRLDRSQKILQAELRAVLRPPRGVCPHPPRPRPDAHACRPRSPASRSASACRPKSSSPSGVWKPTTAPTPAGASPSSARSPRSPTIAAARRSSPASCWMPSASFRRATCRLLTCAAAGPAKSARRSSCRRPYVKYAVDFDGDGRRDLVRSVPDILASTASFLKGHGWQAGGSWEPGSANYGVIKDWNRAEVYQRTISVMATGCAKGAAARNVHLCHPGIARHAGSMPSA